MPLMNLSKHISAGSPDKEDGVDDAIHESGPQLVIQQ